MPLRLGDAAGVELVQLGGGQLVVENCGEKVVVDMTKERRDVIRLVAGRGVGERRRG